MSMRRKFMRNKLRADKMSNRGAGLFTQVAGNMIPLGKCKCGGTLSHFLKSEVNNLFNVYCTNPNCPVMDARDLPEGCTIALAPGLETVVDLILLHQKVQNNAVFTEEVLSAIPKLVP